MASAYQSAKNVIKYVCHISLTIAMVFVFQETNPVKVDAILIPVISTVMGNALILGMKKKRSSKADVKVRYRVKQNLV
jgi:hypothetical protein